MRAYGNHLITKRINTKITLQSGLSMDADRQKDVRYRKTEVVDVPEFFFVGQTKVDSGLKVGDIILYDVAGGYKHRGDDGEEFTIITFDSIMAVL